MLFASVSSSFSPVRLLRLEFWTLYLFVGCSAFLQRPSVFIMDIGFAFFFPCFSSLSAFLQQFPLPFASNFAVYPSFSFADLRVITSGSLFSFTLSARLLLLRGFAAYLAVCLLGSTFSRCVFISFPSFRLRFFLLRVSIVFPCWCVRIAFGCLSLTCSNTFLFLFFSFCVHWSCLQCFVSCFVPSGSVCRLVTCFAFIFVF